MPRLTNTKNTNAIQDASLSSIRRMSRSVAAPLSHSLSAEPEHAPILAEGPLFGASLYAFGRGFSGRSR